MSEKTTDIEKSCDNCDNYQKGICSLKFEIYFDCLQGSHSEPKHWKEVKDEQND